MSAPFVSRWGRAPPHVTFDKPPADPAAGVYSKPLSTLSNLDMMGTTASTATAASAEVPAPDSARRRLQAWEEKRVRFMEARGRGAPAPTPTVPEKSEQYGQPARAQAPSPSTPRGLRDAIMSGPAVTRPSSEPQLPRQQRDSQTHAQRIPELHQPASSSDASHPHHYALGGVPPKTPTRFGKHMSSMYSDLDERRSDRKKKLAYQRQLDLQLQEEQKNQSKDPFRTRAGTLQQQHHHHQEEGRHFSQQQQAQEQLHSQFKSTQHQLPSTAPTGALASKRLSPEDYRAELDRQVEAKLAKLKADVTATTTSPYSRQPRPKTAGLTSAAPSAAERPSSWGGMPQPQQPLEPLVPPSRGMTPEMYRAELDAQVQAKQRAARMAAASASTSDRVPTSDSTPRSRPLSRMSPESYRAELDAQVRAKRAAEAAASVPTRERADSSAVSTAPALSFNSAYSAYDHALPMEEDNEAKRRLEKSRQKSYRLDLDALVKMRAREKALVEMQSAATGGTGGGAARPHAVPRGSGYGSSPHILSGAANAGDRATGMLSGLGNHHFHNTAVGLKQGGAPAFGRGLSSLHSGVTESSTEELLMMKRRQYRLELEKQVEEKKRRDASMFPPSPASSTSSYGTNMVSQRHAQTTSVNLGARSQTHLQQTGRLQRNGSSGFAGFAGLGNDAGRERNVRLGARRHIETETPQVLQEQQKRRLLEAERKEIYANELRKQMAERDARRKAEKERIMQEDERLSRKVQLDIGEEKGGAQGNAAVAPVSAYRAAAASSSAPAAGTDPTLIDPNPFESNSANEYAPPTTPATPPSSVGDMAAGLGGAGAAQWTGFTRFKVASLDPEEHDAMLRKQRRQNETANTLRGQIEERRRRKAEAEKLKEEQERREEERIERERRELEQRYAKQARAEQAQRNKETNGPLTEVAGSSAVVDEARSTPASPKAPFVPSMARSVSAPVRSTGGAKPMTNHSRQSNERGARSPMASTEEEELFRQEMQEKQRELEAQLQLQKDLVAQMQATMAQAIETQRLRHAQQQDPQPATVLQQDPQPVNPQQTRVARRQWASSPTTLVIEDALPSLNPFAAAPAFADEPALAVSPTRYSQEWAAQVLEEAQSVSSSRRPPLPVEAPRSRAMPSRPVDPAFASRPKIFNSLDEADMANVIHSSQQFGEHRPPVLGASAENAPHSIRRRLGAVEQSLDSQSKLVHVAREYAAPQSSSSSSTFMGKTWVEPQDNSGWTTSAAAMPPAPITSAEPLSIGSGGRPASQQGADRNLSIVEQSLASSSKLIFLKSDVNSASKDQMPLMVSQPRRYRPATAASIPTTIPEETASSDTTSTDSATHSSSRGGSSVAGVAPKLENSSALPSIAWDENAPPADHPRKHAGKSVTPEQASAEQGSMGSSGFGENLSNNPSPSMKVVASFLGVNPVIPTQVSPPLSHSSSPVGSGNVLAAASSPATPPREDLKFRVQTPTRKDREAMQQSINRFEATEKLRFESTESTPEVNL